MRTSSGRCVEWIQLGFAWLALCAPGFGQEKAEPSKLPLFPMAEARWVIRGRVAADTVIAPQLFPVGQDVRERFPDGYPDPRRRQNAQNLTLPGVLVMVHDAHRRWTFPRERRRRLLKVATEQLDPWFGAAVLGDEIELTADAPFGDLELAVPVVGGVGFVLDGTSSVVIEVGEAVDAPGLHRLAAGRARLLLQERCLLTVKGGSQAWWVSGLIHCVPHPLFAVTDSDGRFALPPLPTGEYEVAAVHEFLGEVRRLVRVDGERGVPPAAFVFDTAWLRRQDEAEAAARAESARRQRERALFLAVSTRRLAELCRREDELRRIWRRR